MIDNIEHTEEQNEQVTYNIEEAANFLGLTEETMRYLGETGIVPCIISGSNGSKCELEYIDTDRDKMKEHVTHIAKLEQWKLSDEQLEAVTSLLLDYIKRKL